MKRFFGEILGAVLMGMLLPAIAMSIGWHLAAKAPDHPEETAGTTPATAQTEPLAMSIPLLLKDGTVIQMDMNEYLTGVVLAELPADFEQETRKAQAVVARTYALRWYGSSSKHPQGAICTDASCCQGYIAPDAYLAGGGMLDTVEQVRQAVQETAGMVLTYGGSLIDATYFSCSGGRTEDAAAVWGSDVPYLQATDSPGEERAAHFTDTVQFTTAELAAALGTQLPDSPAAWLGEAIYTNGGGVAEIYINGTRYQGTELRRLLGLRSTAFTVTAEGDTVTITTRGFGHRVGMSQYGADAMAVQGCTYEQILSHYYQGVTLQRYSIDKTADLG